MPHSANTTTLDLSLSPAPANYREAMTLTNAEAAKQLGEFMLLSWWDRDRDFESPQHSSEYPLDSVPPGYVNYGINHGARLKVDIDNGRFLFFIFR